MQVTQEHQNLIEKTIRNNARFSGNEDLFDDFYSETLKRSYSIISALSSINSVEGYLKKVSTSAILEVLKTSGRIRRTRQGYEKAKEPVNVQSAPTFPTDEEGMAYYDIPDPAANFEEKLIEKEKLNFIAKSIAEIDEKEPDKKYFELFKLRYIDGLKQKEISQALDISQGEVSKRLAELAKKISKTVSLY